MINVTFLLDSKVASTPITRLMMTDVLIISAERAEKHLRLVLRQKYIE